MNFKKTDLLLISLILFQSLICFISWQLFFKAAADDTLIYHSLKSYFMPLELNNHLSKSLAAIFNTSVSELKLEYFQISFSQLKFKSFYKIIEESSRWLIILFYGISYFFIITRKSFLELTYRRIIIYSSLFFFVAALCLPNDSSDIYGYIARGAQQFYFAMNPYASVVSEIDNWRENIFLTNMLWENNPAPYGPLFMILCKALVALSFGNFWVSLFLFKLINLIAYAVLVFILCQGHLAQQIHAHKLKRMLLILAFNPLFMMELAWNGHNDILMCLFISLAFYFLTQKKYGLSLFMISAAILIKFLAIVLMPLFIIVLIKMINFKSLRSLAGSFLGLVFSLILLIGLVINYDLLNLDYSRFNENLTLSHKSLFNSLLSFFKILMGDNYTESFYYSSLKNTFLAAFLIFACYLYFKFFKSVNHCQNIMKYSSILMFSLIMLASPKFHSWYLLCFLPFSFLSFAEISLVLSFTHLLSFTLIDQANILNFLIMTGLPALIILRDLKK